MDQTTQMTGTSGPSLLMCVTSGLSQSNVRAGHTSLSAWRMAQRCQLFISTREGAQHSWIAWGNQFRSTSKWSVRGWFSLNRSGIICGSAVGKYCIISISISFYLWIVCQCCFYCSISPVECSHELQTFYKWFEYIISSAVQNLHTYLMFFCARCGVRSTEWF